MKKNQINSIFVQNVIFYGDFPQSCKFNATDAFFFDTGVTPAAIQMHWIVSAAAMIGTTCRSYEYSRSTPKCKEEIAGNYLSDIMKLNDIMKVQIHIQTQKLNKRKPQDQHEPAVKG